MATKAWLIRPLKIARRFNAGLKGNDMDKSHKDERTVLSSLAGLAANLYPAISALKRWAILTPVIPVERL
jgi:hypothetical protein